MVLLGWVAAASSAAAQSLKLTNYTHGSYAVHTNLARADADLFARHMNRIYDEYVRRFRQAQFAATAVDAMDLYLFETQADYEAYLGGRGISARNTGGMFFVTRELRGLATFVADRPVSETNATLQHEGFHQFAFAHIGPRLPIWVNEGIAQYFEDGILLGKAFHLNIANARRVLIVRDALARQQEIPFPQLLEMTDEQWAGNVRSNASRAGLQYAQSWSMVLFLIAGDGGKYQKAFNEYLKLVGQGKDSGEAFAQTFGAGAAGGFERAWRRWAADLQPDAVSAAAERMRVLGRSMLWLRQQNQPYPNSTAVLRSILQRAGYVAQYRMNETVVEYQARDDGLFEYETPGRTRRMFQMLEPEANDLPPRLVAPGLKPEPTLVWYRQRGQDLIADIAYR